jgi:dinuclear metal center YbgI/SA1388 family protein
MVFVMEITQIIHVLEDYAPLSLQDDFDNSGLQVGDVSQEVKGILVCLDVTEEVLKEAIDLNCNLILSHHPLLFKPVKKLTGNTYIERCLITACKNNLVIYASHTNLDNAYGGVNYYLAEKIGLQNVKALSPCVPAVHTEIVRNDWERIGSGAVGELSAPEDESGFLQRLKAVFNLNVLKHSAFTGKRIRKVALCGGSGAFLIPDAIACGADVFITGEARYNDYFDVENRLLLAVIGHYESEIITKELFYDIITKKITNFAVHFSTENTNPVKYM